MSEDLQSIFLQEDKMAYYSRDCYKERAATGLLQDWCYSDGTTALSLLAFYLEDSKPSNKHYKCC